MQSAEILTELDYSSIDIDDDLGKTFDPEDEDDEFVRLTRVDLDMAEDEPEYSVDTASAKIVWKFNGGAYGNHYQVEQPTLVRASGYLKIEKLTGPKDDWEEEHIEHEWETDSDWTMVVSNWGNGNLDAEMAPNYLTIDFKNKKIKVDF